MITMCFDTRRSLTFDVGLWRNDGRVIQSISDTLRKLELDEMRGFSIAACFESLCWRRVWLAESNPLLGYFFQVRQLADS